ncbi:hypothetical protein [Pseudolysinimonas kribbensis]|uniref:hypothetical protein n=1 Tax=Pseudolysinimonas kribbensis TaxID=433641 RepID=UPI0024E0ABB3|nr:hypothetical protein [Pseudolysinimonas kribbensis]
MARFLAAAATLAAGILLAGCTGGTNTGGSGADRTVTAETGQAGQFVDNFNPFSPTRSARRSA